MTSASFWLPTTRGVMYATRSPASNPVRRLLLALLAHDVSPATSMALLAERSGIASPVLATRMLERMVESGLLETCSAPYRLDAVLSDDELTQRLSQISEEKRALLADQQGFCLAASGFPAQEVDLLAGLCAEMAALRMRHAELSDGMALIGVGAWHCNRLGSAKDCQLHPIFIGEQQFTLLISGAARLETRALADMVWMLMRRYGAITQP